MLIMLTLLTGFYMLIYNSQSDDRFNKGSIIIYCASQADTESLAAYLRDSGVDADRLVNSCTFFWKRIL